jgi:hypothetical protein
VLLNNRVIGNIMANKPTVVNALSSVADSLVRSNGAVIVPTLTLDAVIAEGLTGDDRQVISESVSTFRSGEAQAIAGSNAVMSASADIASLLKSKGDKPIPFAWFEAIRNNWEGVYVLAQKCEVGVANRAWNRLLEKTDVVKPKADNPKAVAMQKKREEEKKKMEAIPDLKKAMADAMAKGDLELIPALAKEAGRRKAMENQGAIEALKPLKDEIRKQIAACNNKAVLEKIAKLLPKV